MDERLRFVAKLLEGETMTDACREFGISRKTGYKIFNRYKESGFESLSDRSRRPVRYGLVKGLARRRHRPVVRGFQGGVQARQWPFQKRGLPLSIRSDNGVPFASPNSLFNLSKLSVWWLRLGIAIERIQPGQPQQNGRHEACI